MFGSNGVLSMLFCFFLLFGSSFAAPTRFTRTTVTRRQNGPSDGAQTIVTTEQIPTQAGMFTQTCTIVMTPVAGDNGENLIREEKTCSISMGGDPISSTLITTTVSEFSVPTVTLTSSSTINNSASPSSTVLPPDVPGTGLSSIPSPASTLSSQNPVSTQSVGSLTPTQPSPTSPGSSNPVPDSSVSPSGTVVGAAADTSPTSTAFDPPGKQLQVLPIGLGVFAGISVIAIIVVGYVTYERTKHRRNFRKQKMAEAGAQMGYGGMARP